MQDDADNIVALGDYEIQLRLIWSRADNQDVHFVPRDERGRSRRAPRHCRVAQHLASPRRIREAYTFSPSPSDRQVSDGGSRIRDMTPSSERCEDGYSGFHLAGTRHSLSCRRLHAVFTSTK